MTYANESIEQLEALHGAAIVTRKQAQHCADTFAFKAAMTDGESKTFHEALTAHWDKRSNEARAIVRDITNELIKRGHWQQV